jgi:mannose-6-phosphate isomerase
MGTHPSSPSRLLESNETLANHLAANPSLLGNDIIVNFDAADGNIPFLLKILAIEKALSIQTHPDKATAERLHAEQPKIYKGTCLQITKVST